MALRLAKSCSASASAASGSSPVFGSVPNRADTNTQPSTSTACGTGPLWVGAPPVSIVRMWDLSLAEIRRRSTARNDFNTHTREPARTWSFRRVERLGPWLLLRAQTSDPSRDAHCQRRSRVSAYHTEHQEPVGAHR